MRGDRVDRLRIAAMRSLATARLGASLTDEEAAGFLRNHGRIGTALRAISLAASPPPSRLGATKRDDWQRGPVPSNDGPPEVPPATNLQRREGSRPPNGNEEAVRAPTTSPFVWARRLLHRVRSILLSFFRGSARR